MSLSRGCDLESLNDIEHKINTSDKSFGNVPNSQIIDFARIYKAAVIFIDEYFPYDPDADTDVTQDGSMMASDRNFRIDPMFVCSIMMNLISTQGEDLESISGVDVREEIYSQIETQINKSLDNLSDLMEVIIEGGEFADDLSFDDLDSPETAMEIISRAWIKCGAKSPNVYHTTYYYSSLMLDNIKDYIIDELINR